LINQPLLGIRSQEAHGNVDTQTMSWVELRP